MSYNVHLIHETGYGGERAVSSLVLPRSSHSSRGNGSAPALAAVLNDLLTSWRWQARFLVFLDIILAGLAVWGGFTLSPYYGTDDFGLKTHPTLASTIPIFSLAYVSFAFVWGLYDWAKVSRPIGCVIDSVLAGCCAAIFTLVVQYVFFYATSGRWILALSVVFVVWSSAATRALLNNLKRGMTKKIVFVAKGDAWSQICPI